MKTLIAITVCLKKNFHFKNHTFTLCHFKGFYSGLFIQGILLEAAEGLQVREEYLLHLKIVAVRDSFLIAQVLKSQAIRELKGSL